MKYLSLSLSTILFAAQAFAATPFVGKFTVDHANCNDSTFQDAQRVYISFGNELGAQALNIQAYGEDARASSVLLGMGARQLPGTDVKIHGVVTQRWQTQVRGNTLTSFVTVDRPSVRYHGTSATKIVDYGQGLVIESSESNAPGKPAQYSYCRLFRAN
jgi:hypothetical protein